MRYLILIFIVAGSAASAQQKSTDWIISLGGISSDHGTALVADEEYTYVTGSFQGTVNFDGLSKDSNGDTDIFISKYDKQGKLIWINTMGGSGLVRKSITEFGTDIIIYKDFLYVTGAFIGKAKFADIELSSNGKHDIFIVKYSKNGDVIWATQAGGTSQDLPSKLATDTYGNVYLSGTYQKSIAFGKQELTSPSASSAFIVKYSPNGELLWTKNCDETFTNTVSKKIRCFDNYCLIGFSVNGIDGSKRNYISQYFSDGTAIRTWELNAHTNKILVDFITINEDLYILSTNYNASSQENEGTFLEKQLINGTSMWIRHVKGLEGTSICTVDEQLIVAGDYFKPLSVEFDTLQSKGASDIAMISYSTNGDFNWLMGYGGSGQDHINAIQATGNHLIWTGFFRNSLELAPATIIYSKGQSDIFISKTALLPVTAETNNELDFRMYPNPTSDLVNVSAQHTIKNLRIVSPLGIEVCNFNPNTKYTSVDVRKIAKGSYIVLVTLNNQILERKLIIY
jgi:Secretion system C-terminal sorting domain/Beta-propeller repeat